MTFLLFPASLNLASQIDLAGVRSMISVGDFHGAWHAAESQMHGREAWLARSEILYRGGDPEGAYAAAKAGLDEAPGDLDLMFWAISASIWLGDGERAQRYSQDLQACVARASLLPSEAEAWSSAARDFLASSSALNEHALALENAVVRARCLSIACVLAVVLLVAWAARSGYGRSSRPVS